MVLFNKKQIQARVGELAREIANDYKSKELVLIVILKGACWFAVDLSRALERTQKLKALYVEFMEVSSYGPERCSSGEVKIVMDVRYPLKERHVLIVEDVAETRQTLAKVSEHLKNKEPASLRICAAFDKTYQNLKPEVILHYIGFKCVEGFLVGYGMDDKGRCRALAQVEIIEEKGE